MITIKILKVKPVSGNCSNKSRRLLGFSTRANVRILIGDWVHTLAWTFVLTCYHGSSAHLPAGPPVVKD